MTVNNGIDVTTTDALAEITLSRPDEGAWLDAAQRAHLMQTLSDVDPALSAVLIRAADREMAVHPDGGPDLPGPDETASPSLTNLCLAVEHCAVPVFVLMEGMVSGAAAEIALAARGRIATPGARIAFPAARLGRISGAGSTQRLPRLVGADHALRLLTSGKPIPAPEALVIGLVDQIVEGETAAEIVAAAQDWALAHSSTSRKAPGLTDGRGFLAAVTRSRAAGAPGSLAQALADCVEAALLLPAEQGLAFEVTIAVERDALPQTAALAHLVRAERAAAQTPEPLRAVKVGPISRPALVGASPQLAALALMALARGLPVTVLEPDRARLVPMLHNIAERQEAAVQSGTLSPAQRDADWARLRPVVDSGDLARADLVVVAADKQLLLLPANAPLLLLGRGELPKGAFRLVLSGRVAELGLPAQCGAAAAAQALAFLRRMGQIVVITGTQSPLGISGRLAGAGAAALRSLLDCGVPPDAILSALTDFGLAAPALPKAEPGAPLRRMSSEEIVNRWLGALANEGARLLAAGLAQSATDVDLVAVHGLGLPAECGGPLHQADQRGLLILRRDLRLWGEEAEVWKPVPALDALVSVGRGFLGGFSAGISRG